MSTEIQVWAGGEIKVILVGQAIIQMLWRTKEAQGGLCFPNLSSALKPGLGYCQRIYVSGQEDFQSFKNSSEIQYMIRGAKQYLALWW